MFYVHRVYDNAKANAVMQRAIAILTIEERLSHYQRMKFRTYLHAKCSPEEDFYDDDATEVGEEDLKKVTFQIKVISYYPSYFITSHVLYFFGLFQIWGRRIRFSLSTFSGLVLLLSVLLSPPCIFV